MKTNKRERTLIGKARQAAKDAGMLACQSRRGIGTRENHGGFALIACRAIAIVAGWGYSMTAEEVIRHCAGAAGMPRYLGNDPEERQKKVNTAQSESNTN